MSCMTWAWKEAGHFFYPLLLLSLLFLSPLFIRVPKGLVSKLSLPPT